MLANFAPRLKRAAKTDALELDPMISEGRDRLRVVLLELTNRIQAIYDADPSADRNNNLEMRDAWRAYAAANSLYNEMARNYGFELWTYGPDDPHQLPAPRDESGQPIYGE